MLGFYHRLHTVVRMVGRKETFCNCTTNRITVLCSKTTICTYYAKLQIVLHYVYYKSTNPSTNLTTDVAMYIQ